MYKLTSSFVNLFLYIYLKAACMILESYLCSYTAMDQNLSDHFWDVYPPTVVFLKGFCDVTGAGVLTQSHTNWPKKKIQALLDAALACFGV